MIDASDMIAKLYIKDTNSPRPRNRPKGMKVCSFVEKFAMQKSNSSKIGLYTKVLCAMEYSGGYAISQNSATMGVFL